MKLFVDTLIEMKMDECDDTIKEINAKVEEIGRREPYIRKGSKEYKSLQDEFWALVNRRLRLEQAKNKLSMVYTRRNMEAFFNEYNSFEDFVKNGVVEVIVIKKDPRKGE